MNRCTTYIHAHSLHVYTFTTYMHVHYIHAQTHSLHTCTLTTCMQAVKEFNKADKNKNNVLSPQEFMDLVRSQVNTVGRLHTACRACFGFFLDVRGASMCARHTCALAIRVRSTRACHTCALNPSMPCVCAQPKHAMRVRMCGKYNISCTMYPVS